MMKINKRIQIYTMAWFNMTVLILNVSIGRVRISNVLNFEKAFDALLGYW